MRVALAQLNPTVGDLDGNVELVLHAWRRAADAGADLVIASELVLTGYPPDDLLLKDEFVAAEREALHRLAREGPPGCAAIVGHVGDPGEHEPVEAAHWDVAVSARELCNSASVLAGGEVTATYRKWRLPNYGVFDEARYFTAVDEPVVVELGGVRVGLTVCEDMWALDGPVARSVAAGAEVVCNLNASPYHRGKRADRLAWARRHVERHRVPLVYVNQVGGQDEVVFDGDSFVLDADGEVAARGAVAAEDLVVVDVEPDSGQVERVDGGAPTTDTRPDAPTGARPTAPDDTGTPEAELARLWDLLALATRDYVRKNGFERVWVAVSGGIDSAVTAAIAVDALGADHVTGIALPSSHSSGHSRSDAHELGTRMGFTLHEVPIAEVMDAFTTMLADHLDDELGLAEENLQSRIRGTTMMALSNEHGGLVLTTGNKSEYAVGYATLYGDMNGAFGPLKDVSKTLVWELARWRNRDEVAIPESTISKPPSAELAPDQLDTDSLPPYAVLDEILERLIERDWSIAATVADGHDEELVREIARKVDAAEFKRRQSAPGPKVTVRAFGRDRRVPITNAWRSPAP